MIFRKKNEKKLKIKTSPDGAWTSYRFLLKKDKVGFTLTETVIKKGSQLTMQYMKHIEACYCIKGKAQLIQILKSGRRKYYPLNPGTMYCLNKHDRHILKAKEQLHLVCVFLPALKGNEIHNSLGSYEA